MYPRGVVATLILIVCIIIIQTARHRSHTSHLSEAQLAVTASTPKSLAGRPFDEVNFVAGPKGQDRPQRDFCRTIHSDVTDQAASMIKVPITFHKVNFFMFCYKEQDIVSKRIRKKGSWEAATSAMVLEIMEQGSKQLGIPKENAVFLDIGVNIGWYSLLLAAAGHSVISFEPMPTNKELFMKSICSNPDFQQRLTFHTDMLSDSPHNNCTMYSDDANVGDGTVSCDPNLHLSSNYHARQTSMDMTTLDIALSDLQHPIFMVKMDVEGHEGHVLQGATKTILQAQVPYIMFEFCYAWVKQAGGHPDAVLKSLVDAGYQFSFEEFYGKPFDPLVYYADVARQESPAFPNVYCVHKKMLNLGIERKRRGLGRFFG